MARRRFVRGGPALRQGQRRESLWIPFGTWVTSTIAADAAVILTSLSAAALALRPFTIVRTRGFFSISTDQAGTTEHQTAILGQIVVSDEAVAIGVTAVPTPETEGGSDWHLYEPITSRFLLNSAVGFDGDMGRGRVIDSKAMRKVDLGEDLISVVEVGASGNSEGLISQVFLRSLIKLH